MENELDNCVVEPDMLVRKSHHSARFSIDHSYIRYFCQDIIDLNHNTLWGLYDNLQSYHLCDMVYEPGH